MSLIGSIGKATGVLIALTVIGVLLPVLGLVVLLIFLVRQRPQQVSEEAPEPYILSRIVHRTSAHGAGTMA